MDGPNAPAPTNPAGQDQFMDAVQGSAVQGPTAQGPVNNNAPIGPNAPVQPPHQLAPVQPVCAGLVVHTPQVVYQNWVGKNLNSQVNLKKMHNHLF